MLRLQARTYGHTVAGVRWPEVRHYDTKLGIGEEDGMWNWMLQYCSGVTIGCAMHMGQALIGGSKFVRRYFFKWSWLFFLFALQTNHVRGTRGPFCNLCTRAHSNLAVLIAICGWYQALSLFYSAFPAFNQPCFNCHSQRKVTVYDRS